MINRRPPSVPDDVAPIHGHDDMSRYWHELRETWEGTRLDPLEVLDADDGHYVVDMRLRGISQRTGAEVDRRLALSSPARAASLRHLQQCAA